jgi:hypothetical protein
MSIIDKASLVLIPSGYSEGFVYPIKNPINPGRISYTRNATSTRVNSKGLIESVPYNLFGGSNSALGVTTSGGTPGTTLTANAALAPDGSYTATLVDYTTAIQNSKNVEFNFYNVDSKTYTASIWVKGTAGQTINLVLDWNGYPGTSVQRTLDGTWQRFTLTKTYSENYSSYGLFRVGIRSLYGYSGTATQVYIWGVQLVEGTEAKDYLTTTDRLNFPTLDYSTGKPTFLFEPSVTNLLTYSEDFSNAVWSKQGTLVGTNQTIAPNGNNTADTISTSTGNEIHRFYTGPFTYASTLTIFSFSVYLKYKDHRYVSFGVTDDQVYRSQVVVDLVSGVITHNEFQSGTLTSNLQPVGNGWYRLTGTFTPSTFYFNNFVYLLGFLLNQSTWSQGSYIGTGTGVYIWGVQLQEGTAATSYIPTTNASVTRAGGSTADLGSSYFGTNKGTLLLGVEGIKTIVNSGSAATMQLRSGGNVVMTLYDDGSGIGFYDYYGTQFLCPSDRTTKKMLIKWDGTTSVGFVNGVKTATSTTGSARSIDNIQGLRASLNAYNLSVFAIFPEALSDAECISLTS